MVTYYKNNKRPTISPLYKIVNGLTLFYYNLKKKSFYYSAKSYEIIYHSQ